jgi:hypothetical protein
MPIEYEKLFRRKSIKDFYSIIQESNWDFITQKLLEIGIALIEKNKNFNKEKLSIESLQKILSKYKYNKEIIYFILIYSYA